MNKLSPELMNAPISPHHEKLGIIVILYNHCSGYQSVLTEGLYVVSGRVGLWKDIFTVSMNDKFDAVYRQKMGKSDLTFDFSL